MNAVEMWLAGRWSPVDYFTLGIDCRDRDESPRGRPRYRTYVIRGTPSDPRAARAVLDWLVNLNGEG